MTADPSRKKNNPLVFTTLSFYLEKENICGIKYWICFYIKWESVDLPLRWVFVCLFDVVLFVYFLVGWFLFACFPVALVQNVICVNECCLSYFSLSRQVFTAEPWPFWD